jgi:hypothetical protein
MKLDLERPVKSLNGDLMFDRGQKTPILIRDLIVYVIRKVGVEELDGDSKKFRYDIAGKVLAADEETEFSLDELKAIKDMAQVKSELSVDLIGALFDALEGK